MGSIAFVGMDIHKATIAVAVGECVRSDEVRQLGILTEPRLSSSWRNVWPGMSGS